MPNTFDDLIPTKARQPSSGGSGSFADLIPGEAAPPDEYGGQWRPPPDSAEEQAIAADEALPTTSGGGALVRSAVTGVAPAFAAAAGFLGGATITAPSAPATWGIGPVAGGVVGAAGLAQFVDKSQKGILKLIAPESAKQLEKLQQADAQQHPWMSAGGRFLAALPTFELNPGQTVRGLAAIPKLIKGVATPVQKQAIAATGVQGGLGVAQGVIMPLTEGEKPTLAGVGESTVQALMFGNPRIKALIPASLRAAESTPGMPETPPARTANQETLELPVTKKPAPEYQWNHPELGVVDIVDRAKGTALVRPVDSDPNAAPIEVKIGELYRSLKTEPESVIPKDTQVTWEAKDENGDVIKIPQDGRAAEKFLTTRQSIYQKLLDCLIG